MTLIGWLQIALVLAAVPIASRPLGHYMARVFQGERTRLSSVLGPVENAFYAASGIEVAKEQNWLGYTLAMLAFNAAGFLLLYGLMRLQAVLPLNPQGFAGVLPDLAFNTVVSFVTNTDWQAYGGETTMSHLVQMVGLTMQNFVSAATGIALAVAVTRAFARSGSGTIGNFWVDLTRTTLYVLLPLSLLLALAFILSGSPQTLAGNVEATGLDGAKQTIALGPVASQEAIKQLGTNGGGFFNANAAHPFENPNAWSNLLSIWSMLPISTALTFTFGRMVGDTRQGYALLTAMGVLLISGVAILYWSETAGNPLLTKAGGVVGGNMEGKEVRFGQAMSALYTAVTTGLSCGAVNTMHNSLTPLGGLVPLFLIQLGEILPGGVGSGLYGMIVMAILAVFVAGLTVGRTPEYLGKKIEAREMKFAMLAILVLPLAILGFSATAAVLPKALESLANAGPRGFTEILYAYSSAAGNNGSAFAGLNANTPWYNTTLGIAMLLGRFAYVIPVMAIAGALAVKIKVPASPGRRRNDIYGRSAGRRHRRAHGHVGGQADQAHPQGIRSFSDPGAERRTRCHASPNPDRSVGTGPRAGLAISSRFYRTLASKAGVIARIAGIHPDRAGNRLSLERIAAVVSAAHRCPDALLQGFAPRVTHKQTEAQFHVMGNIYPGGKLHFIPPRRVTSMSDDPKSVSRRSFLTASAAVVAGTATAASDAEAFGFLFGYGRVSKAEARYQSRPRGG